MPIYITKITIGTNQEPQRIFATKHSALQYIKSFAELSDTTCFIEQWAPCKSGLYRYNKNVFNIKNIEL